MATTAQGSDAANRAALLAPLMFEDASLSVAIRGAPRWRELPVRGGVGDAATVAAHYRAEGTGFLAKLGGSFAIAIVDRENDSIVLAIDRFGIERIAYAEGVDALYFATSAEALARAPAVGLSVDLQSIYDYLFFHMIPAPRTLYRGVAKLPAASLLRYRPGRLTVERYWQPQFAARGAAGVAQPASELLGALETGVRDSQPQADSGAFLSGGLDSSSVSGVLARVVPRARTFSIGFATAGFDELEYARIAAKRYGCEAVEYVAQARDVVELLPSIAAAYDEPFGNSSALPTLCCARLAREHGVSHLLAGDGGDEIFAGNSRYVDQQVFERYALLPRFMRRGLLEPALNIMPRGLQRIDVLRRARNYVAQANTPLPRRLESWNLLVKLGIANLLAPEFLRAIDPEEPLRHMDRVYGACPPADTVDKMMFYDWQFTLADNDLRKVEAMCELAGVRVSYPMLDNAVVDLSTRVPPDVKIAGGSLRYFYKDAMRDFLPREIIEKKKHGFGLPFGLWLRESPAMQEMFFGALSRLRARRVIRTELLDDIRRLNDTDDASYYGVLIWVLAMLEHWLEQHKIDL
jgi:asparagine synthase (glutamine-hydrolysing)